MKKVPDTFVGKITRFAPSPTGQLHLGHVASAIYVWGLAQKLGAKVIVRIENHDESRSKAIYEQSILEDLDWLGFLKSKETIKITRQKDSYPLYQKYLEKLAKKGLVYSCSCSRKTIQSRQSNKRKEVYYDGKCRTNIFDKNQNQTVRLRTENKAESFFEYSKGKIFQNPYEQCGDFAIRNQKKHWTYQYSSTIDDIESGVNLIIRGNDIFESTGRQVYLRSLVDDSKEILYKHHPLIIDKQSGLKLSKSDKTKPISLLRQSNIKASEVLGQAAFLVGLTKRLTDLEYLDLKNLFI